MTEAAVTLSARVFRSPWSWARRALLLLPVNVGVWFLALYVGQTSEPLALALLALFTLIAAVQFCLAVAAVVTGVRRRGDAATRHLGAATTGVATAVLAAITWAYGAFLGLFAMGGGWGRPLRVRGRQRHPELRTGADWTDGERPDRGGLDAATCAALEALWLHDAQKEHASVPAFARVAWLLAAVGAPPELLIACQQAAIEEIDHARRCFALAAGYGGRTHTVQPMPDLLLSGLRVDGDALRVLAVESLGDGCLLEDFNADIAAACAAVCEEPVTRALLQQIAREERSHAEFSWAVVEWVLVQADAELRVAIAAAGERLPRYRRPTAVSWHKRALVARADAGQLRRHGRLPDAEWGELWQLRLQQTMVRAAALSIAPRFAGAI